MISYSQEVLQTVTGLYGVYYDSTSRTHYQFFEDSISTFQLNSDASAQGYSLKGIGEAVTNYNPVTLKGELLIVSKSGGIVMRVSPSGLQRIDNSFDHRMQSGSQIFTLRDTLFRHGGYGMWSVRKELSYFDYSTKEWELYKLSRDTEIPPGAFGHLATVKDNKYTIFYGATIDPKDPLTVQSFQEVWQLDFSTKKWKLIGKLKDGTSGIQGSHSSYLFGNSILQYEKNITYNVIEPEKNLLTTYQGNPVYLQVVRTPGFIPILLDSQVYFYRVKMLHESTTPVSQMTLEFCRMPVKEFLLRETGRRPFLAEKSSWPIRLIGGVGAAIMLSGVMALFYRSRRKSIRKVQLTDSGISCGQTQFELSEQEVGVIRLLLRAKADITTNDILEITSNPKLDYTQNLRLKNQMIEKLNEHFGKLLDIQDEIILTDRSDSDRRIKRYRIRREVFEENA